jgi:hypothetical protein
MKNRQLKFKLKFIPAALAFASAGVLIFAAGNASAIDYGTNITIPDGIGTTGTSPHEDNEVEPGMSPGQVWDLEGFFLNSARTALTIVGGYNFYAGYGGTTAGDIFIDTDGNAVASPNLIPNFDYNPGYQEVSNSLFKYDYVLDINWGEKTFDIIKLDANSILKDTQYGAAYNQASNPWKYVSGGADIGGGYITNAGTATDTGFSGWNGDNHYVGTFDITGIDLSGGGLFHNTMECGNDNLIGKVAPVPEPATMLLFGTGIAGLVGSLRRRRNNG